MQFLESYINMTKKLNLWMLTVILFCGLSLANVSCTSEEDHPSGQSGQVILGEGFFTSEINALIDANYPEVIANGYAELIIPSTMFDTGMMKYADYHKDVMVALNKWIQDLHQRRCCARCSVGYRNPRPRLLNGCFARSDERTADGLRGRHQ